METNQFLFLLLFFEHNTRQIYADPCYFWPNSQYFNGTCYKLSLDMANWNDAQTLCRRDIVPAKLSEPKLESALTFLMKTLTFTGEDWWIGGGVGSNNILQPVVSRWATTKEVITSGNVTISGTGQCVEISDTNSERLLPLLTNDYCSLSKKFVCEFYVGNPCVEKYPGAVYSYGYCFKPYTTAVFRNDAITTCAKDQGLLAEFDNEDSYYFVKNYAFRLAVREVWIAANSILFLEDYNINLNYYGGYFPFNLRACRDVKVYLWSDSNTTAPLRSSSTISTGGEYYVIDYGVLNVTRSTFSYCKSGSCYELTSSTTEADFHCTNFVHLFFSWDKIQSTIWVSKANLWVDFKYVTGSGSRMLDINRVAIGIGNSSAIWRYKDPVYGADVSVGGSDKDQEGVFTWLSSKTPISISDWLPNEPNDWIKGEDDLGLRISDEYIVGLNDMDGTSVTSRPLCQKDALNYTYLIPLLETQTTDVKVPEIHVSTVSNEVVYLQFQQTSNGDSSSIIYDWVTPFRSAIFKMDANNEMQNTGFFKGMLVLRSAGYVTVVLFQSATSQIGTTLVYPIHYFTTGYFILSQNSSSSGNHISISAFYSNTEITVRFPRSQSSPVTVTYHGMTFQQVRLTKLILGSLDSVQFQSLEDFSGTFVYSTRPVVVCSGSKNLQSQNTFVSDHTLDMSLDVDTLSHHYVTYPSSSGSSTLKFVALYDDTKITIYGPTLQHVVLSKAGDVGTITLLLDNFYLLESDTYHPFYVVKLSSSFFGSCMVSLTPETLWARQHSVYVKMALQAVFVVMDTNSTSNFIVDDSYLSQSNCHPIAGSSLSGCSLTLLQGLHSLGFNGSTGSSTAYTSPVALSVSSFCHGLGTAEISRPSQARFPALQYLELSDSSSFRHPLLPEVTTQSSTPSTTSSSSSISSSSQTSTSTTSASPTSPATLTTLLTTSSTTQATSSETAAQTAPPATPIVCADLTSSTQQVAATTKTSVAAETFQSTQSMPTATSSNTTASSKLPATETTPAGNANYTCRRVPTQNLTHEEIIALLDSIQKELLLDKYGISAYKQKSISIWDSRPSSHALGISGVLIITFCIAFLTSSDILRVVVLVTHLCCDKTPPATE